jgi:flagellar biogenesis protein FliO
MEQMNTQTETRNTEQGGQTAKRIVGVIFGAIEVILAFRFIFKAFGANSQNAFVKAIYSVTQFFVGIFEGIFSKVTTVGAETRAIFEPATLIAMIIVALIAWAVMRLLAPSVGNSVQKTQYTENNSIKK